MTSTDLFLTHDWGEDEKGRDNHDRVAIVNAALKSKGYITWFDGDRMQGDVVQQMSQGIEKTKVVLTFITKRYEDKITGDNPADNCKLEFNHAARIRKSDRMIAIVMEARMRRSNEWKGPLGMHLGGKLYIDMSADFSDRDNFMEKLDLLSKELRGMQVTPNIKNTLQRTLSRVHPLTEEETKANAARSYEGMRFEYNCNITFVNKHKNAIYICWKDYTGEEYSIRNDLLVGESTTEYTNGSSAYIARDNLTDDILYFITDDACDVVFDALTFGVNIEEEMTVTVEEKRKK